MDAQSPSKRFTRGFWEGCRFNGKSNAMKEVRSKLKNDPIRLEKISVKSKQSYKDKSDVGSSKKRKV
ncbi:hypothetical protein H5410_022622 [Solanum commersonii]|uniref:Uncharacterized protein n=1 Tax=Solanum commersonii TaxID=4109 RepID=A0A9J5ZFZ4_SOLCO|nr:hypothetical protein H5410_022622 [Solanum commersonii]